MFFQVQWAKNSALRVPLPLLTPPSSFVKRLGGFDTRQLLLQKRVSRHQLLIDFFKLKRGCECADILLSDGMIVHAKSAEVRVRRLWGVRWSLVPSGNLWGGMSGACFSTSRMAGSRGNRPRFPPSPMNWS
ncbi:hypothetical protein C347_05330 [Cryptococcus neoformans AD2-60a]|nr:hypothetical protein C347_05330 [Cryptococcus neoformans var. grubii AD2-60a]OXC82760.1 hypothetical protein C344_05007 [Cryptococcus neoformans var. grubii AD1-7a]OXH27470.1 hypothetical protein J005_05139 [Cryptococcus neoformans var. grubii]